MNNQTDSDMFFANLVSSRSAKKQQNIKSIENNSLPRFMTHEGQARIEQMKKSIQVTPDEPFIPVFPQIYLMGGCGIACGGSNSYSYQSGSNGGSPF